MTRRRRSASACIACSRPARAGSSPPSSRSRPTSSRTRCWPPRCRSRARSCRFAPPRRSSRCSPIPRREELGNLQADGSPRSTSAGSTSPSRRGARGGRFRRSRDRRAETRRRRASRCASSAGSSPARAARWRPVRRGCATLVRPAARAGARAGAVVVPRRVRPPAFSAGVDVHEGARGRDLPRHACRLGFDLEEEPIRLDLEDRPQKSPRACVIASDPPQLVHLITRAQGGLHDYQAFLHEAGHALHYAGCDPSLPYAFRQALARPRADRDLLVHPRGDHEGAGMARALLRALARAGGGERRGDDLPRGAPLPALHREAPFRARLLVALREEGGTPEGYEDRLTKATGVSYRDDNYIADMDAGFYSADYLRAWIRAAQLRRYLIGRPARTGGARARRAIFCGSSSARVRALERRDRRAPRLRSARHRARSSKSCRRSLNFRRHGAFV